MSQEANQSLWDWAVRVHAAPGVDEALLALQDAHGQCVSFLLWAAWSAGAGRALKPPDMARAASLARRWEGEVTGALRAVRRTLKQPWPGVSDTDREALRAGVKDNELNAERRLMEALEAISPASGGPGDIAGALRSAAAAWSDRSPDPTLASALDHLAQMAESVAV